MYVSITMWPACVLKQDPESFVFRNRFILTHFESLSGWWTVFWVVVQVWPYLPCFSGGSISTRSQGENGDGISVRSLCWASHVLLYPGPFPTYAEWNISIMFRVFFPWMPRPPSFFFFGGGFRGFPKKVRLFLGQTNNNNMAYIFLSFLFWWVTQGKISRVLAAKLSLCCRVDALGDQALLPRMEMGWWGWWRVGDKVGERLSWWQICKHMYIYRYSHGNGKKSCKKNNGCLPFWMMINQYEKRWCFKKTDM